MKKLIFLNAVCLLLAAFVSCSNDGGSPATQQTPAYKTHTESTNFLTDWETMEFLYINDANKLDTKIAAPWNSEASSTNMPDSIRFDVKKADGWEVAFNLMNKDGYPDDNWFALYNKYTGVLRIFYYYNKGVASSATDFAFDVILGSDGVNSSSYYSSLNYGIPMDTAVNPNVNLLGAGNVANTFHLLITPYSCINRNTMSQGWYAFDVDMSAYTGKTFYTDGSGIHIDCRANNKTTVSLGTDIKGKLGGDITLDTKQASSNGLSGILSDISGWFSSVGTAIDETAKAAASDDPISGAAAACQWGASALNLASIITKTDDVYTTTGKIDLKLTATADTKGYFESEVSTNVMPLALGKTAFNPDSNIGKGVWNLDKSPEIYFISDRIISVDSNDWLKVFNRQIWYYPDQQVYALGGDDCRLPYFYDPSSFNVEINKEVFPDTTNMQVLSYCGIYERDGNKSQNTAFREALGIGNLQTEGLALPPVTKTDTDDWGTYCDYDQTIIRKFFAVHTKEEYSEGDIKFNGLSYKSYGEENDIHYYGQELGSDGKLNFILEPQIFYAKDKGGWQRKTKPTRLPELYVVVCVKFDSGGKHFYYTRTFLPKVSEIKYEDAKTKVADIKTRLDKQTDKVYRDEYKASLDKKMEFLKTE